MLGRKIRPDLKEWAVGTFVEDGVGYGILGGLSAIGFFTGLFLTISPLNNHGSWLPSILTMGISILPWVLIGLHALWILVTVKEDTDVR